MPDIPIILKSNSTLTPYKFYTEFLEMTANFYQNTPAENIRFRLFEKGDEDIYASSYRIDPIVIPLLLSLFEQLSKFHKTPLQMFLHNNQATVDALEFLYRCNFFDIAGNNDIETLPKGRNILDFETVYFGAFKDKKIRNEHRVRAYSIYDDGLNEELSSYESENNKRDFLISHFTYKTREHFQDLLFDNHFTADFHNLYLDILSELITNSVLHGGSTAFALMFVDRFKTKFSISDNGVGFSASMKLKEATSFYNVDNLKTILSARVHMGSISKPILDNLFTIFDTLYYSSLKDRHGLFDLMLTVVLNGKGYFRIHTENSQIIVSNRMMDELKILHEIRKKIYAVHVYLNLEKIQSNEWNDEMIKLSREMLNAFVSFCEKSIAKYSSDIRYSSIRFYKVKFRGVHIEVEIPNSPNDDYFSN